MKTFLNLTTTLLLCGMLGASAQAQTYGPLYTAAGTVIHNQASLTLLQSDGTQTSSLSNVSDIVILTIPDVYMSPHGFPASPDDDPEQVFSQVVQANALGTGVLTYQVSNTGNATDQYGFSIESLSGAASRYDVYRDNGDNVFTPDDTLMARDLPRLVAQNLSDFPFPPPNPNSYPLSLTSGENTRIFVVATYTSLPAELHEDLNVVIQGQNRRPDIAYIEPLCSSGGGGAALSVFKQPFSAQGYTAQVVGPPPGGCGGNVGSSSVFNRPKAQGSYTKQDVDQCGQKLPDYTGQGLAGARFKAQNLRDGEPEPTPQNLGCGAYPYALSTDHWARINLIPTLPPSSASVLKEVFSCGLDLSCTAPSAFQGPPTAIPGEVLLYRISVNSAGDMLASELRDAIPNDTRGVRFGGELSSGQVLYAVGNDPFQNTPPILTGLPSQTLLRVGADRNADGVVDLQDALQPGDVFVMTLIVVVK